MICHYLKNVTDISIDQFKENQSLWKNQVYWAQDILKNNNFLADNKIDLGIKALLHNLKISMPYI